MTRLGIALVGAGPWGRTLARSVARLPGAQLRWICELDEGRRAGAGAEHPEVRLTGVLDEVFDDSEVGAVMVAVAPAQHCAVAMRVLEENRHLWLEKPMALSVADATRVQQVAAARSRFLLVNYLLLRHPAVNAAHHLVMKGAVGSPLCFESTRLAPANDRTESAWWTLAPHDISLALHFFQSPPVRVSVTNGKASDSARNVASAILEFGDGRCARVHVGRQGPARERRFSVAGTDGALSFDELDHVQPLRWQGRGGMRQSPVEPKGDSPPDPLTAQLEHFLACLARGDFRRGNDAHALSVVRVLEAGEISMRAAGASVELV